MSSDYCSCANTVMKGLDKAAVATQTVMSWITTSRMFLFYQGLVEGHTLLPWYFAVKKWSYKVFKDNELQSGFWMCVGKVINQLNDA